MPDLQSSAPSIMARAGAMARVGAEHGIRGGLRTLLGRDTARSARAHGGKLHIVHIVKHCSYANGSVHVAVDLACTQAEAGHAVVFVSGGGTFVPMLERHGVRHITLRQDQRRPHTLLWAGFQLIRLCRRTRPDILHAHMMGGAVIGYAASLLTGIPLVTTVHNSFDPHSLLMRLGHRVVAVSRAERDHLIKRGYDPRRVSAVWNAPNGSPREAFMRNDRELVLAGPCITVICALHRRKGVFDIIEACTILFDEFPGWRLYIAGEGPDRDSLEQLVQKKGLAGRVTFLGFVPAPRTLYEQSDIFVLASYADPGSLSVGEARAAGCAIIATAVGGTTEMLEYGAAGRLVQPNAPRQLAEEMRRLMQDPAKRAALSAAAAAGSEVFNVQRLVADYDRIYQAALRDAPRSGRTGHDVAVSHS